MDNHFGAAVIPLPINFAASGDNTVIAAPTSPARSLTVVKFFFMAAGATDIIFKCGARTLSGPLPFTTGVSIFADYDPIGWYTAFANEAFILNSSNAVQISGTVYYVVGK